MDNKDCQSSNNMVFDNGYEKQLKQFFIILDVIYVWQIPLKNSYYQNSKLKNSI